MNKNIETTKITWLTVPSEPIVHFFGQQNGLWQTNVKSNGNFEITKIKINGVVIYEKSKGGA